MGAPRNTKWLNVTQTQQMFEQLSLAYDFGIQRMWILNVGDLKPMEYPIQLFMDMAWNPKEYTQQTVTDHTRRFFEAMFALSSSSASLPSSSASSSSASLPSPATTPAASAAGLSALPSGGFTFTPSVGFISIEAEHFFSTHAPEGTAWSIYPYYGRTRSAVALTPYTKPTDGASLSYRFTLPDVRFSPLASTPSTLDSVTVHVVVKSTLDFLNVGGHEYTVSLDDSEPQVVNFNKTLVDRQPYMYSEFYPAVARRVVEKTITIPASRKDFHELTLSPRHPGIVFEKIVIDFGGYQPQHLFGTESPYYCRDTNHRAM